jgi:hypothetical protein
VHFEKLPHNPEHARHEADQERYAERHKKQPREAGRGYVFVEAWVIAESARHSITSQPRRNRCPGFRVRGRMLSPAVPEKIELVSDGTRTIPTQNVMTTATA